MTPELAEQIRELRYMDGLSCIEVAARLPVNRHTVQKIAPGQPGKIDNTLLREAFLEAERAGATTAADVARAVGWLAYNTKPRASGKIWHGWQADTSRVRRALGITADVSTNRFGTKYRSARAWIDAEHAERIANAIGVAPWAVGCND